MSNNQQVLGTEPVGKLLFKILSASDNWYDGKRAVQCGR